MGGFEAGSCTPQIHCFRACLAFALSHRVLSFFIYVEYISVKKKTQSVHLHKEVTYPYVLAILHYMYITHICNLFL